jgi:hypothetical protein
MVTEDTDAGLSRAISCFRANRGPNNPPLIHTLMRQVLGATALLLSLIGCRGEPAPARTPRQLVDDIVADSRKQQGLGPIRDSVVKSGSRSSQTELFDLNGGAYHVEWSAASDGHGCSHSVSLKLPDGTYGKEIIDASVDDSNEGSGSTNLYGIASGRYFLSAISGCQTWTVSITSQ